MKDYISRYLMYGCSKKFPDVPKIKESNISFSDAKDQLLNIVNQVVLENITSPQNTIFQCSGGFDSSVIISYFKNISTFCTCRMEMSDYRYSYETVKHFKTNHIFISEEELTENVDLESSLIEMNKIHSAPRGYTNDLGLYLFVKRIKEYTDIISGGEGIELMYLGYIGMYRPVICKGISKGEYDVSKALGYRKVGKVLKDFKISVDFNELIKLSKIKDTSTYLESMNWWSTGFTFDEAYRLGVENCGIKDIHIFDFVNFMFSWFGSEFYFDRRLEYANHFNLEWISPFLDKRFIDFSLSLPVEMRNCLGQIKYVMYESLGSLVPNFTVERPKEGLVLSSIFYEQRKDEISDLLYKYLKDPKSKIYEFLDFKLVCSIVKQFDDQFDFIVLKKVWMLLNLELWLELN